MLIVADLTLTEIYARMAGGGLPIAVNPFHVRIYSKIPGVAESMRKMYADYVIIDDDELTDFHVSIERGRGLRRFFGKPQSRFLFDSTEPFKPLPLAHAYPSFEWGVNWCVANHSHQYLIIHAAVVERGGRVAILAAPSGSGKSTLCAGLVNRGWRLFSDELALIEVATGAVVPFPRPVCLKNESIDVIKGFAPEAEFGQLVPDTRKGTITHMRAPSDSVRRSLETGLPGWILFPRFEASEQTRFLPMTKARAGYALAENAFNFSTLGEDGFSVVSRLVDASDAYELDYGDLADATRLLTEMADSA